jgi:hypothetical protein
MFKRKIFAGLLGLISALVLTGSYSYAHADAAANDCTTLQNGIAPQIQALAASVVAESRPSKSADIQALFQANQKTATDISALLSSKLMPSLQSEDGTASAKMISKSLGKIISEKFVADNTDNNIDNNINDANDIAPMNLNDQSALVQSLSSDLAVALQAICE